MVAFALCLVHSSPNNIRSFLLNKLGVDPDVDMNRCKAALQAKALEILGRWETALGAGGGVQRPFLCGDRPGLLDCRLVTKLNLAYQLLESGLANLGAPFAEVAPLTFSYLGRFSKRDSWTKAFGPGREVGTGVLDVVTVRTLSNKFMSMCPEVCDSVILPALAKARRLEQQWRPLPAQHLQTHMHSSEAPSKVSHKICLVTGYGRSSFGDTRLDGDLPMSVLRSGFHFFLLLAIPKTLISAALLIHFFSHVCRAFPAAQQGSSLRG